MPLNIFSLISLYPSFFFFFKSLLFRLQDVALLLEDIMETDFNTICEDDSPMELGDLLCTLWHECGEGNFTIATNALAREYERHERQVLARSQGIDNGDEVDSDDDEEVGAAQNEEMMLEAVEEKQVLSLCIEYEVDYK